MNNIVFNFGKGEEVKEEQENKELEKNKRIRLEEMIQTSISLRPIDHIKGSYEHKFIFSFSYSKSISSGGLVEIVQVFE